MNIYSYIVEHDFGLAPNPFGEYCTLTVCKPLIRKSKNLKVGDWIVGTGSKAMEKVSGRQLRFHIVYAMKVTEIVPIEDYWNDIRFQYKKPVINGTLVQMYGDNFYYKDEIGNWHQIDSAHSNVDGSQNDVHLKTDIGGKNAIISNEFYYFGNKAVALPNELRDVCHTGIGQKILNPDLGKKFIQWLEIKFDRGIHGKPINWSIYKQKKMF